MPCINWDRLRDNYDKVYRDDSTRMLRQRGRVHPFWEHYDKTPIPNEPNEVHDTAIKNILDAAKDAGLSMESVPITGEDEFSNEGSPFDQTLDGDLVKDVKVAQEARQQGNDDSLGLDDDQLQPTSAPSEGIDDTGPSPTAEEISSTPSPSGRAIGDTDSPTAEQMSSTPAPVTSDDDIIGDQEPPTPAPYSEEETLTSAPSASDGENDSPTAKEMSFTAAPTITDGMSFPDSENGIPIPRYEYSSGTNCADSSQTVPCAPDNIRELCAKGGTGKFSSCLEACIPSFCCIHDAPPDTNAIAPNCNSEPNCAAYAPCYIAWWKLHDTVGPATLLQLEQNDDFFDVSAEDISGDVTGVQFLQEMLFHHFDNADAIIEAGTVNGEFDSDRIFLNPDFWDAENLLSSAPPNP